MKISKLKNKRMKLAGALFAFAALFMILILGLSSAASSTSVYKVQYTNPFGSSYSSLMSGVSERDSLSSSKPEEFFDMMVYIPPAGCQPYVVRSDLLEEQNVPVFCQLVPVKINPGIDITRIASISVVQKEANPYIAGIGFHPARAAIQSKTELISAPYTDNIGYVVVVLKKQETEKSMPDFINVTLAASMNYGAKGGFGIGESEFYLPVLSDEDFSNRIRDSSFFNGMGYLRAESIDENSAVIAIYTSDNRRVFSQRIERGKTSGDYYLPTETGGQGIRISLQEITLPQTKAKIRINDQVFEVYNGARFFNGKCSVRDIISYGGANGKATISCGSSVTLEKKFNKVSLSLPGGSTPQDFSVGDMISQDDTDKYYLVYLGKTILSGKYYIYVAKIPNADVSGLKSDALQKKINSITKDLSVQTKNKEETSLRNINKIDGYGIKFAEPGESPIDGITFASSKASDLDITPASAKNYFQKAVEAYDALKSKFGSESYSAEVKYGEEALWREYELAEKLNQNEKSQEILSRIENEYPQSRRNGRTAKEIFDSSGIFSAEDSTYYDEKNNLLIELVSVEEPDLEDASAEIIYSPKSGETGSLKTYRKGDSIDDGTPSGKSLTLTDFDNAKVTISYSCKKNDKIVSDKIVSSGNFVIPDCDNARINVIDLNLEKVAKVKLTPITAGRSRETNFTFSIGIEKRAKALQLSPEAANRKIKELNEKIAQWRNLTQKLGKLIEIENAACLATSAILNVKNLFSGMLSKDASARRDVMERWNDLCAGAEFRNSDGRNYANAEDCIAGEYSTISSEISATAEIQKQLNTEAKSGTLVEQIKAFKTSKLAKIDSLLDSSGKPVTDYKDKLITNIINDLTYTDSSKKEQARITQSQFTSLKNYYMKIDKGTAGGFSDDTVKKAKQDAYDILKLAAEIQIKESLTTSSSGKGITPSSPIKPKDNLMHTYLGVKWESQYTAESISITANEPVAVVDDNLFVLQKAAGVAETYQVKEVYKIKNDKLEEISDDAEKKQLKSYVFEERIIYKNKCKNCNYMKVFTTEPYRGMPSLLPFDDLNGWYVKTEQLFPGLGTGNQKTFADSGEVNSFYICNVGDNGLMDSSGDLCKRFDKNTGDLLNSFPALSEIESRALVSQALNAIKQAQSQFASNPSITEIKITGISKENDNNGMLKVQDAAANYGSKCTDFMSPKECQLIFNVCDPVVCPNSRCDFGGKFKVDNVIQSGIVGSTFLCLPNFIGLPGNSKTGVVIPVCLTGLHAGIDYWASIMESYRDCLNESVTTGKMTGICDAMQSVYVCDFFWRQAGPFTNAIFKNLFVYLSGEDKMRGGGEYMFVSDAWANAQKSWQFFTTDYLKGSKLAFGAKSIDEIGTELCKMGMSTTYPDNFKSALEPESPVQYNAFFEEIPYTDVTVPASSQYKVSYHIYAGNEQGHYYSIYLKSAPTTIGYAGKDTSFVVSGYVPKGEQVSESKDYIDVSGFKELCIRIDAQDKCGFKSVSTGAMINYLKQQTASDAANKPASSESECVAGGRNAGALITPNIQQAVEELINPESYNQGIIRVCSSENPGNGADNNRWTPAGNCSAKGVRCWLDTNSVKKTITASGILNDTLSDAEKKRKEALELDGYFGEAKAKEEIDKIKQEYNSETNLDNLAEKTEGVVALSEELINSLPNKVSGVINKFIFTKQKAELSLYEAKVYDAHARNAYVFEVPEVKPEEVKARDVAGDGSKSGESGAEAAGGASEANEGGASSAKSGAVESNAGVSNINMVYDPDIFNDDLFYKFNNRWHYKIENGDWVEVTLSIPSEPLIKFVDDVDREFTPSLFSKSFIEGINLFEKRVLDNKGNHNVLFTPSNIKFVASGKPQCETYGCYIVPFKDFNEDKPFYLFFQSSSWRFNAGTSTDRFIEITEKLNLEFIKDYSYFDTVNNLIGKDKEQGLKYILNKNY